MASSQPNGSSSSQFDAIRFAGAVAKATRKNSLTRSAKDNIAMYPAIASGDIPTDDMIPFSNALAVHYASLFVSVISANSTFNMVKYPNAIDYIKANFHNNDSIPAVLRAGIESCLPDDFVPMTISAAHASPSASRVVSPDFVMECWVGSDMMLNHVSLNHGYTPAADTQFVMESLVEDLRSVNRPAMEATAPRGNLDGQDFAEGLLRRASASDKTSVAPDKVVYNERQQFVPKTTRITHKSYITDPVTGKRDVSDEKTYESVMYRKIKGPNKGKILDQDEYNRAKWFSDFDAGDYEIVGETKTFKERLGTISETGKQEVIRNQQLNGLEPVMVNLQLTGKQGGDYITQNLVMGVKVVVQQVSSDIMVANLVQGVSGSRAMFDFIKWTKGQYGFIKDFIFGVANAKESAVSNKDMRHWIGALKRRKQSNLVARLSSGESVPPNTTVILTSHEAARVAEQTGVDLNEPYAAIKLMNAYYFLGIAIVDTATGTVKTIFDGDNKYGVTSINALRSKTGKSDTDLTTYVSILRAAGGLK